MKPCPRRRGGKEHFERTEVPKHACGLESCELVTKEALTCQKWRDERPQGLAAQDWSRQSAALERIGVGSHAQKAAVVANSRKSEANRQLLTSQRGFGKPPRRSEA
jgi:hypothetical protein